MTDNERAFVEAWCASPATTDPAAIARRLGLSPSVVTRPEVLAVIDFRIVATMRGPLARAAVAALAEVLSDPDASSAARVSAARTVLDYCGHGGPTSSPDASLAGPGGAGAAQRPVDVGRLAADLAALRAQLEPLREELAALPNPARDLPGHFQDVTDADPDPLLA